MYGSAMAMPNTICALDPVLTTDSTAVSSSLRAVSTNSQYQNFIARRWDKKKRNRGGEAVRKESRYIA